MPRVTAPDNVIAAYRRRHVLPMAGEFYAGEFYAGDNQCRDHACGLGILAYDALLGSGLDEYDAIISLENADLDDVAHWLGLTVGALDWWPVGFDAGYQGRTFDDVIEKFMTAAYWTDPWAGLDTPEGVIRAARNVFEGYAAGTLAHTVFSKQE